MKGRVRLFTAIVLLAGLWGCGGGAVHLGVQEGMLAPCAKSPNCVVSQGDDEHHFIPAIHYSGSKEKVVEELKRIIAIMERANVVEETEDYIRVEFVSAHLRFVDDGEFYFSEPGVVQIRSASRYGYSDFNVNRERMEKIRALLTR